MEQNLEDTPRLRMGVDQSYNFCAWTILQDNNVVSFGVIKSKKEKLVYERALDVALELCDVYKKYLPAVVQIEGLAFGTTGNVTRDLAGLLFTIINTMKIKCPEVKCIILPPTAVKKFATGSGKSKKPEIIAALPSNIRNMFEEQGFKKTTGLADLADAYWIALYNS